MLSTMERLVDERKADGFIVPRTLADDPRATLLFPLMRLEGVHILDGFCGFLTTEHGVAECASDRPVLVMNLLRLLRLLRLLVLRVR